MAGDLPDHNWITYLTVAGDVGNTPLGAVGDIQVSDPGWWSAAGTTGYQVLFPFNQLIHSFGPTSTGTTWPTPGSRTLQNSPTLLPRVIAAGAMSQLEDHMYELNLYSSGPVNIHLSSTQPFEFQMRKTVVCPVLQLQNVTGCYQCNEPVIVVVNTRSTCAAGDVQLTSNCQLMSHVLAFGTDWEIHTIYLQPDTQNIDCEITAGDASIEVVYSLYVPDVVLPVSYNGANWQTLTWDWIKQSTNYKWLIIGLAAAIALVFAISLICAVHQKSS